MLVSVGRAKITPKSENFGFKVCSLGPRGDLHMRPRGVDCGAISSFASLGDAYLVSYHCGLPQGLIPGCLEVSCAGRLEVSGNKL